jgi:hypothetical protein
VAIGYYGLINDKFLNFERDAAAVDYNNNNNTKQDADSNQIK